MGERWEEEREQQYSHASFPLFSFPSSLHLTSSLLLPPPPPPPSHSPLVLIGHGVQRRGEAPDVVGLVAVVAQDLALRLVLPPTHTARTILALPPGVVLAVLAVWLLLASLSLALCVGQHTGMSVQVYACMCA